MFLTGKAIAREILRQDTLLAAESLLRYMLVVFKEPEDIRRFGYKDGLRIPRERIAGAGRIVECEAYLGKSDKACHSYKARPEGRTNVMYGDAGYAYIYLIYGVYNCLNVVTRGAGEPEAVLLRALEALEPGADKKIFSGPGKLCRELGVTRADYGTDLCGERAARICLLRPAEEKTVCVETSERIGVGYGEEAAGFRYRFYNADSPGVSKTRKSGFGGRI
jgi:DNA-3-methyladenine glycosylase